VTVKRSFGIVQWPARCLIAFVRLYQATLSRFVGGQCRFHPSCSEYCIGAVEKYGAIVGGMKAVWRILRCHPFHPGGHDPP
jgi:putative membrane protein insertion efficiency factor